MKISDPNGKPLSGLGVSQTVGPAGDVLRAPAPAIRATAPDRFQLSNLSAQLAAAFSSSPAHLAKLAGLSAAVLGGGYRVDASLVSNSIIRHSLQFGGADYL
jgi:hypothetical protein